ncbi:lytic murein transglycosylase B [Halomonas sp. Bachu 37]|uniref:lytic murein transglycosylase B n=1 Tax=Halomonas kashgarensis TaxID=3084920 RepID=UPI003217BA24
MKISTWKARIRLVPVVAALIYCAPNVWAQPSEFDPAEHAEVARLVENVQRLGVPRDWLEDTLREAEFSQTVLDAMEGAAERRLSWGDYRDIFIQSERIEAGAAFMAEHAEALERVEARYGVPPEIVAAIIGVETYYGRHTGRHRVLDSLATLAFHHPSRGEFFRGELAAFLEITHEQGVAADTLKGSYAGAMGYPQFLPTSYRAYAVDFDGDGQRDLWHNPVDAIGSVGNYFAEHGWRAGDAIYHEASGPAELPGSIEFNRTAPPYISVEELQDRGVEPAEALEPDQSVIPLALDQAQDDYRYRLGRHNFYVITRYNHSHLYAMAVTELAAALAEYREEES